MKHGVKNAFMAFVFSNTALFLLLAYLQQLSTDPKSAVFIDFWGRFTVYSLWYIMYALYRKYLEGNFWIRRTVVSLVCANIPMFLLLAYFDKISNSPDTIVFVDFWGRITVYSLWFIVYEAYRKYIDDDLALNKVPVAPTFKESRMRA